MQEPPPQASMDASKRNTLQMGEFGMAGAYDARFEAIVADIIAREGGYVDHPNDRGGPTKYGITKGFLAASRDVTTREITKTTIKNLTIDQARKAYHTMIWQRAGVHRLPSELQPLMFEWITMSGPSTPTKFLQERVGSKADGILGPKTAKATRETLATIPYQQFKTEFVNDIIRFLIGIARRDNTQIVFLEGWFNRFCHYYV